MKDDFPDNRALPTVNAAVGKPLRRIGKNIVILPDVDDLVCHVKEILDTADADQARLTRRYIEAGRGLWKIREECRQRKENFATKLARSFPGRKRSTLREYMTLAKYFDKADQQTKVQMTGLFKHGWGAVLGEFRKLRREEKFLKKKLQSAKSDAPVKNLTILNGDCMVKLPEIPAESVDCVITSIPYYQRFVFPGATTVFGEDCNCDHDWEIRRTTRRTFPPRTVWKNRPHNSTPQVVDSGTCRKCGAERGMLGCEETESKYVEHVVQICNQVKRVLKPHGAFFLNIGDKFGPDGGLRLIPHKLAIAITNTGWICRSEHIWHVQGRAPDGAIDRPTRTHESVFMLVKQKDYSYDAAAMKERGLTGTVWSFPNERVDGHPCPFPKALVEPMILSTCPEGGVCLDPMAGSGTTGLVALAHGRAAILIEANSDYCELARRRIETELGPYKAEIGKREKPTHGVVSRSRH